MTTNYLHKDQYYTSVHLWTLPSNCCRHTWPSGQKFLISASSHSRKSRSKTARLPTHSTCSQLERQSEMVRNYTLQHKSGVTWCTVHLKTLSSIIPLVLLSLPPNFVLPGLSNVRGTGLVIFLCIGQPPTIFIKPERVDLFQ